MFEKIIPSMTLYLELTGLNSINRYKYIQWEDSLTNPMLITAFYAYFDP